MSVSKLQTPSDEEFFNTLKDRASEAYSLLSQFKGLDRSGKLAALELISGQVALSFRDPPVRMLLDGSTRCAPLERITMGRYEEHESEIMCRLLADSTGVVLDVGAHVGWFGIRLSVETKVRAIHMFEPIPDTYAILTRNVGLNNHGNLFSHNVGMCDVEGKDSFYYSNPDSALASRRALLKTDTNWRRISADVTTIDKFCSTNADPDVAVIKCDVEGDELAVLRGATSVIQRCRPILLVEVFDPWCRAFGYSGRDILSFLAQLGFNAFAGREDGGLEPFLFQKLERQRACRSLDYNVFFLHQQKHSALIKTLSTVNESADWVPL